MTASLASIKDDKQAFKTAVHRVQADTKGLGYWGAFDFLRKNHPKLLWQILEKEVIHE